VAATIYLFEDDADLRALLLEILQTELGANAVVCKSLAEVLRLSASTPPDLIVADFWGASQLKLTDPEREQVAALGKIAPTVLVSARQWALDAGPAELGLAAVVHKPLDVHAFVNLLRRMLLPSDEGLSLDALADEDATQLPKRDALSVLVLPWAEGVS
jgi:DNA-binding NtrC family response regulator